MIETGPPPPPTISKIDGLASPENAKLLLDGASDGEDKDTPPSSKDTQKRADEAKAAEISQRIAAQLKAIYDDVLNQPVPERFLKLLKKLDSDESP